MRMGTSTHTGSWVIDQTDSPPLHPAIRPQYEALWQQRSVGKIGQNMLAPRWPSVELLADRYTAPSHPNPRPNTSVAPTTNYVPMSLMGPWSQPPPQTEGVKPTNPPSAAVQNRSADARTSQTESPPDQLKLQLRRISDPPNSFKIPQPHPAIKATIFSAMKSKAAAPSKPSIPQQTPPPQPQFEPHPTPHQQVGPAEKQCSHAQAKGKAAEPPHHLPGSAVRDFAVSNSQELSDVPADSTAFMEEMMKNLRRASQSGDTSS